MLSFLWEEQAKYIKPGCPKTMTFSVVKLKSQNITWYISKLYMQGMLSAHMRKRGRPKLYLTTSAKNSARESPSNDSEDHV